MSTRKRRPVGEPSLRSRVGTLPLMAVGLTALACLALVFMVLRPVFLTVCFLFFGPGHSSFDGEDWADAHDPSFANATRLGMVDDLLRRHPLVGMDAAGVKALLGLPDSNPYLLVEQPRHRGAFIYRLGPDHMMLDSLWLVVAFGDSDVVSDARVVSD